MGPSLIFETFPSCSVYQWESAQFLVRLQEELTEWECEPMNSCVLMVEIIQAPELRYTQDGNTAIAEMVVQFPSLRAEDPMSTLKVMGWGNLAQQIQEQFHQGDQVIVEGRLNMRTVERPEGFKEKLAELRASRVHSLNMVTSGVAAPATATTPPATATAPPATATAPPATATAPPATAPPARPTPPPVAPPSGGGEPGARPTESVEPNYDDIPF